MLKARNEYVDIAKGICMLLIICIHTEVFGLFSFIPTFIAVPMFFFMSVFFDKTSIPLRFLLIQNLKLLVLPAVVWCVISTAYLVFLQYVKNGSIIYLKVDIYNPCAGNGPSWFLVALFYVKLITWVFNKYIFNRVLLIVISITLGYIGSTYQMPLLFDEGLAAIPFYIIGKIMYANINQIIKNKFVITLGILAIFISITRLYYFTIAPTGNGFYSPNYLLSVFIMLFVFIAIIYFSSIEHLPFKKVLSAIGRNSMGIMLIHVLLCHSVAVVLIVYLR